MSTALQRAVAFLLLLTGSVGLLFHSASAQPLSYTDDGPIYRGSFEDLPHAWVSNIGEQLRASLNSRSDNIRFRAMQEISTLGTLYPGQLDLRPTVPSLLQIYRSDGNESFRLAAVNALYVVGDSRSMAILNDLSYADIRSRHLRDTAQHAVRLHFATVEMKRHEALAEKHHAAGNVKKAARHTRRADGYRKQIG